MTRVTIYTTEIEKIFDALVADQFTGGSIEIIVNDPFVTLKDKDGRMIAEWDRLADDDDKVNGNGLVS